MGTDISEGAKVGIILIILCCSDCNRIQLINYDEEPYLFRFSVPAEWTGSVR